MPTLIDSNSESNQNDFHPLSTAWWDGIAQTFVGNGGKLDSCKFYLKKTGSPTGNITAKLYAVSAGVPTGSALATSSNVSVPSLTTSYQLITFTFDGTYTLTNGTTYAIAIERDTGDNEVQAGSDNTPAHSGQGSRFNSGSWATDGDDMIFYVYSVTAGSPQAGNPLNLGHNF